LRFGRRRENGNGQCRNDENMLHANRELLLPFKVNVGTPRKLPQKM
jgi:hypothetical protein